MKRAALLFLATAALLLAAPAAAGTKQRPRGMPSGEGISFRSLAATFGAQRVVLAVRNRPAAAHLLRAAGARPLAPNAGLWSVSGRAAAGLARDLDAAGLLRYLSSADARLRRTGYADSEPMAPQQWWLAAVGADTVSPPGPGIPLVIVDDGIDTAHPEFVARPETLFLNENRVEGDDAHGTAVASVAAAPLNGLGTAGMYPQARLRSYDTADATCEQVVAGFATAIAADKASVINLSGGFPDAADCPPLYDVVTAAFGTGHLVVAAAGNDGEARDNFPAAFPHVISVAASTADDRVSGFSTSSLGIDLAAPGESIPAAVPVARDPTGYLTADGTSLAAPLVSAAAAWAWTLREQELGDVTQLFELIRAGTRDVGAQGWEPDSGFGVLHLPTLLTAEIPGADHSEPNDDIYQVVAGGLFKEATTPLLPRGRSTARVNAYVDLYEDPVDIYRIWVPGGRAVSFRLLGSSNVDLEVFRAKARTIFYRNRPAALRGSLFGGSYRLGKAADTFSVRNGTKAGAHIFVCVYKPLARGEQFLDATYQLNVRLLR